ncbi:hypothetical protein FYK55_26625 [Roseiconus nitratireducens]|uniref:Uncharacterized protein n=1 Tax=Roseiconus nitratireducens TaxID=2605748 RepID=A0A5M6CXG9_9BACT|nr:CehA/McbA family metallohydrolase [Roseiconus nitratireducens]KAA5538692.1 hypothetical protein FYK55_26625 [Roseiconus nitratireducens]
MNPNRLFRPGLLSASWLAFSIASGSVLAHETESEWPSAAQLSEVQPALDGAVPFARRLITHFRNRLPADAMERLDQTNQQLEWMRRISEGQANTERKLQFWEQARVAEYFRWRAERTLLQLLRTLPDEQIVSLVFQAGADQPSNIGIVRFGAQHQTILLRVDRRTRAAPSGKSADTQPASPMRFSIHTWDWASEREGEHFRIDVASEGVTWLLLDLKNMPEGRHISYLSLHDFRADLPLQTIAMELETEPRGQLAVDVVDDEGESIPVLMRIEAHDGGELWEPAEALDLRPLLNDIVPHLSSTGRGYPFYLPGDRGGRYWIVKPPLEMPLPTGKWDISVIRGLEFEPLRETVSVDEGRWTRIRLQPKRWIEMPSRGWYSGDDHVHARLQTSEDARKLIDYTAAVDIHVANVLEMGDVMRTYYPQRGFGRSFRVHDGDHWVVPGQEDPRSVLGHAIGLNLQSRVRDVNRYLSNDWVADNIHRQGGLYGHTHVGPQACFVHREMALWTHHGIVDFNSIMQATLGTELFYDFLNLGFKMTASAGADTPYGGTIGAVRTYAYCGNRDSFTPDQWFAALKRGNTFVTNGPMLEFQVDGRLPGEEILVDDDRPLRVRAKAIGAAGWSAPRGLRLIKLGETVAEVSSEDALQTELSVELTVDSRHGFWIAAHATGHDGSEAHTTPVYVTREGFRHWNVTQVPQLIEKQLRTLDEIEAEVGKAKRLAEQSELDYWSRRTADQSDQVLEDVSAAREFYQRLKTQWSAESQRRDGG